MLLVHGLTRDALMRFGSLLFVVFQVYMCVRADGRLLIGGLREHTEQMLCRDMYEMLQPGDSGRISAGDWAGNGVESSGSECAPISGNDDDTPPGDSATAVALEAWLQRRFPALASRAHFEVRSRHPIKRCACYKKCVGMGVW